MFLGSKIIFIRPRKSQGKPKAKGYINISIIFRRRRFITHGKNLNVISDGHLSSDKFFSNYINISEKNSPDGVPKVLILLDLYEYNPGKFLKQFCAKKTRDKSYKKRSGILLIESVESVIKETFYKKTTNIE